MAVTSVGSVARLAPRSRAHAARTDVHLYYGGYGRGVDGGRGGVVRRPHRRRVRSSGAGRGGDDVAGGAATAAGEGPARRRRRAPRRARAEVVVGCHGCSRMPWRCRRRRGRPPRAGMSRSSAGTSPLSQMGPTKKQRSGSPRGGSRWPGARPDRAPGGWWVHPEVGADEDAVAGSLDGVVTRARRTPASPHHVAPGSSTR